MHRKLVLLVGGDTLLSDCPPCQLFIYGLFRFLPTVTSFSDDDLSAFGSSMAFLVIASPFWWSVWTTKLSLM